MEHHNRTDISRDQKCVTAGVRIVPSHAHQSAILRDLLTSDNPNLLCASADLHHEMTGRRDDTAPKHVRSRKKRVVEKLTPKEDELVRYMSNMPSFLEKGKNIKEQPLNVGVLDWRSLEKWQCSQNQMSHKHKGSSLSSSDTSLFSRDASSNHSSRGPSCSPTQQRMHRLSLHSPLEASLSEARSSGRAHSSSPGHQGTQNHVFRSEPQKQYDEGENSQNTEVFRRTAGNFQESINNSGYNRRRQQKVLGPLQQRDRKGYDLESHPQTGLQHFFDKFEGVQKPNGERNQSKKEPLRSRKTKLNGADQYCSDREESGVVIMPRNRSETSWSGVTSLSYFPANSRFSVEPAPKNILGKSSCEDPLASEADNGKCSNGFGSKDPEGIINSLQPSKILVKIAKNYHDTSRIGAQTIKCPSQTSQTFPFPARMFRSPSRSRKIEEKQTAAGLRSVAAAKPSEELDMRNGAESIPKTRNPSPIRRLSFSMGKRIKNVGSRDNSPVRRSISKDCTANSGSDGAIVSAASIDNPCSEKSSATDNRGRSSPLKRLLEPFLKSRGSKSSEPCKKHPSLSAGTRKSCSDQADCCDSVTVKSRSADGRMRNISDPHHNSKKALLSLQALLQVSFKNGFPLFTFAIDDESDILAATVRKSFVPAKGDHIWTYTFFTVKEMKRKTGVWLNKGDHNGYVPDVVAQMKVSDSQDSTDENGDFHITREFDLFAVDAGHEDHYATNFHPTNELAAIIVKLPRIFSESHNKDDRLNYDWVDSSHSCLTESMQKARSCAESVDDPHFSGRLNFSTTVILPGGVHTVPSKGEISTLVHRWSSGGSCDCGGWDLGCQLLIYTNKREYERRTHYSIMHSSEDMLHLFSQVAQDNEPVLSLAPIKERIYSVEFNSSLSLLQAFAICMSFLDRRRPAELSEPIYAAEKITNEIGVFEIPSRIKTVNDKVDCAARYLSNPPHSPVGRV